MRSAAGWVPSRSSPLCMWRGLMRWRCQCRHIPYTPSNTCLSCSETVLSCRVKNIRTLSVAVGSQKTSLYHQLKLKEAELPQYDFSLITTNWQLLTINNAGNIWEVSKFSPFTYISPFQPSHTPHPVDPRIVARCISPVRQHRSQNGIWNCMGLINKTRKVLNLCFRGRVGQYPWKFWPSILYVVKQQIYSRWERN